MSPRVRAAAPLLLVVLLSACAGLQKRVLPAAPAASAARLPLDSAAAPVEFRWLADEAVLVSAHAGKKALAAFGNFVRREAGQRTSCRLSVWDDEAAWKTAGGNPDDDEALAHKRAEYVREDSPPVPVDRFLVFDHKGMVVYQRDFRAWPLTEDEQ